MAIVAAGKLETERISEVERAKLLPVELTPIQVLDVVQCCLHARPAEWIFLRELRVGTGFRNGAAQRLDAFALNCFAHASMRRACYEVKICRTDFLSEIKQPLKRRIGLRYSNEFYFATPAGLMSPSEIPIECGLVEVGLFTPEDRQSAFTPTGEFVHFDPTHNAYCRITVPAPWRETPGPTWQFVAGMLRNQQRGFRDTAIKPPHQQRLPFAD
jgi:hypothetical protein